MNYKLLLITLAMSFQATIDATIAEPFNAVCFCLAKDTRNNKDLFAFFHPADLVNHSFIAREECIDDLVIWDLIRGISNEFCEQHALNLDVQVTQGGDTAELIIPVSSEHTMQLHVHFEEGLVCTQAYLVPVELFRIFFGPEISEENKSQSELQSDDSFDLLEMEQFEQFPDELPAVLKRAPLERTVLQKVMRGFALYYYACCDYVNDFLTDVKKYLW